MATRPQAAGTPPPAPARAPRVRIAPLTAARWDDLVKLFGPKGAYGGCWCMWFRLPRGEWAAGCADAGRGNRRALRGLAGRRRAPGLLAYVDGEPAGWCALAPRAEYLRLAGSRTLQPVDDTPVWSVTCFYVARAHRGQGLTVALLEAAAAFAARHGARMLEGYPNQPNARWPDAYAYQGTLSAFTRAGFHEVKRVSPTRAIVRRVLVPGGTARARASKATARRATARGARAARSQPARAARTSRSPRRPSPRG